MISQESEKNGLDFCTRILHVYQQFDQITVDAICVFLQPSANLHNMFDNAPPSIAVNPIQLTL